MDDKTTATTEDFLHESWEERGGARICAEPGCHKHLGSTERDVATKVVPQFEPSCLLAIGSLFGKDTPNGESLYRAYEEIIEQRDEIERVRGIEQRLKDGIADLRQREATCRRSFDKTKSGVMLDSANEYDYRASNLEYLLNG